MTVQGAKQAQRDLQRIRYPFLTPIGRDLPPRGSMAREMMEAGVQRRRAVRAFLAALGIRHRVDFAPAWRRLELIAYAYVAVFVVALIVAWVLQSW